MRWCFEIKGMSSNVVIMISVFRGSGSCRCSSRECSDQAVGRAAVCLVSHVMGPLTPHVPQNTLTKGTQNHRIRIDRVSSQVQPETGDCRSGIAPFSKTGRLNGVLASSYTMSLVTRHATHKRVQPRSQE